MGTFRLSGTNPRYPGWVFGTHASEAEQSALWWLALFCAADPELQDPKHPWLVGMTIHWLYCTTLGRGKWRMPRALGGMIARRMARFHKHPDENPYTADESKCMVRAMSSLGTYQTIVFRHLEGVPRPDRQTAEERTRPGKGNCKRAKPLVDRFEATRPATPRPPSRPRVVEPPPPPESTDPETAQPGGTQPDLPGLDGSGPCRVSGCPGFPLVPDAVLATCRRAGDVFQAMVATQPCELEELKAWANCLAAHGNQAPTRGVKILARLQPWERDVAVTAWWPGKAPAAGPEPQEKPTGATATPPPPEPEEPVQEPPGSAMEVLGWPVLVEDGVARVDHRVMAQRLEYPDHKDFKALVERYLAAGDLSAGVISRMVRGIGAGRPALVHYLPEQDALFCSGKSDQPKGNALLRQLIAVFIEVRRLATAGTVPPAWANDPVIAIRVKQLEHDQRLTALETASRNHGLAAAAAGIQTERIEEDLADVRASNDRLNEAFNKKLEKGHFYLWQMADRIGFLTRHKRVGHGEGLKEVMMVHGIFCPPYIVYQPYTAANGKPSKIAVVTPAGVTAIRQQIVPVYAGQQSFSIQASSGRRTQHIVR